MVLKLIRTPQLSVFMQEYYQDCDFLRSMVQGNQKRTILGHWGDISYRRSMGIICVYMYIRTLLDKTRFKAVMTINLSKLRS
jgi:hypothetical protein